MWNHFEEAEGIEKTGEQGNKEFQKLWIIEAKKDYQKLKKKKKNLLNREIEANFWMWLVFVLVENNHPIFYM